MAIGRLPNLFATAKAIRDNQGLLSRLAHFRKKHSLSAGDRNRVMLLLKAESSCHSATARLQIAKVNAHFLQQLRLANQFHDRPVMAMAMNQRRPMQLWDFVTRRPLHQKFREGISL